MLYCQICEISGRHRPRSRGSSGTSRVVGNPFLTGLGKGCTLFGQNHQGDKAIHS